MNGYEKLKAAVERDCNEGEGCFNPDGCNKEFTVMVPAEGVMKKYTPMVCKVNTKCFHKYCDKFKWVIDRAKHYGEKLGLNWEDILDSWEADRNYWYMNYYQDCNQPEIKGDKVRVFESVGEMRKAIGKKGFWCPACGGVSKDPYACNSGLEMSKGKVCDWKVFGLFGDLGKGVFIYCKDKLKGETIFMPVAWEAKEVTGK
jgi:hypothetical protein